MQRIKCKKSAKNYYSKSWMRSGKNMLKKLNLLNKILKCKRKSIPIYKTKYRAIKVNSTRLKRK